MKFVKIIYERLEIKTLFLSNKPTERGKTNI